MKNNSRVVILGSNSFVLSELIKILKEKKIKFISLSRKQLDLTKKTAQKKLNKLIKKNDKIIFASAQAPVKNLEMLNNNLYMCRNLISCLKKKKNYYLIYISSDAVYSDSLDKLTEKSKIFPESLHGVMHFMREEMLKITTNNLCIVRPTLVYGDNDPHNGYGPNKFVRLAQSRKNIKLFGKGEELRDHIHVSDVGESIYKILSKKYKGTINLVSGKVVSFYKIANKIKNIYGVKIMFTKRNGNMPHNGYRAFNNKYLKKIIIKKSFIDLLDWLDKKKVYKKV